MQPFYNRIAQLTFLVGSLIPYRVFAQTNVVERNLFVNDNSNATLFPLSRSTQSLGTVIFVRGFQIGSIIIGIVSIAYLIFAAIQFSTAAGDEAKIEQAKKALIWSLVGIAVFMVTFLIISATQNASKGTLE